MKGNKKEEPKVEEAPVAVKEPEPDLFSGYVLRPHKCKELWEAEN